MKFAIQVLSDSRQIQTGPSGRMKEGVTSVTWHISQTSRNKAHWCEKPGCEKPTHTTHNPACVTQFQNAQDMSSWPALIWLLAAEINWLQLSGRMRNLMNRHTFCLQRLATSSEQEAIPFKLHCLECVCLLTYRQSNNHTTRLQRSPKHEGIGTGWLASFLPITPPRKYTLVATVSGASQTS